MYTCICIYIDMCTYIYIQFQFFTLNLKNSDKTKSWGVDCDRANLD